MNHPTLLCCLLFSGALSMRAAEGTSNDSSLESIPLPLYEVAETRSPQAQDQIPWLRGSVAGFDVLSSAPESQTRKLLHELQRFRIAIGAVWPDALKHAGPPVTIIICGRDHTFDAFAPFNPDDRHAFAASATRFFADKQQAFVALDVTRRSIQYAEDDQTRFIGQGEQPTELVIDHYDELIRSYVRYLVRRPTPPPPPWLAEGLTQLISRVKYDRSSISFGELPPSLSIQSGIRVVGRSAPSNQLGATPNDNESGDASIVSAQTDPQLDPAQRDEGFGRRVHGIAIMPMAEFFAVAEDSHAATHTLGTNWPDQAHAFVHLGIYGENGRFQKPFLTFIARLQSEPLSEALFTECFGMNYKKFNGFLQRYTASTWYKSVRFDLKDGKLPEPDVLQLQPASPAEVARTRGDALLILRGEDTAFLELVRAYKDGSRDPELLGSLGIVEARRGHEEEARAFLEAATKSEVSQPRVYTELARLRLSAVSGPAGDSALRLSKAQLASVLRPLFLARKLKPALPETYALIAQAWARSEVPPSKQNLEVLLEGAALFPSDSATLLTGARLHQMIGAFREAAALAALGATWAQEAGQKQALLDLKAALPADAQVDLAAQAPQPSAQKKKSK